MSYSSAVKDSSQDTVLVIGASGLLGSKVYSCFIELNELATYGICRTPSRSLHKNISCLDVSDYASLISFIDSLSPARIINCLGLADIEECEKRPEANWKLNAEIPSRLADFTFRRGIGFVHISTDHFESKLKEARREIADVYPVNQYGYAKFSAERIILNKNPKALVIRTNFFGFSNNAKKSLLNFAIENLLKGNEIDGFDDVIFNPVGISELSRFLVSDNSSAANGVLNFASERPISKYDFMLAVSKMLGKPESLVKKSSISNSKFQVTRPNYLALDSTRLNTEYGYYIPTIDKMLREELAVTLG